MATIIKDILPNNATQKLGNTAEPFYEVNATKFYKVVNGVQTEVGGGSIAVHAQTNTGTEVENSPIASTQVVTLKAGDNISLAMDMTGVVTITAASGTPTALDASVITSGVLDIARIPQAALERLVTVANQAARFALTTTTVQQGDTVKELDTGYLFAVVDEANLGNANGYVQYTAGGVSSVAWGAVTDKPSTLSGYGITDAAAATHNHDNMYEPKNSNIQAHISSTSNPHGVTAAQAGAMATTHAANAITGFGVSGSATTVARSDHSHTPDPRTLVIPGASGAASGFLYLPTARTLASVIILCKTLAGADSAPSASTTIVVNKVVGGTTTAVATIATTTAQTTYDVSPDASIEAGAYLYAAFSGSNNGVYVANVIPVWG